MTTSATPPIRHREPAPYLAIALAVALRAGLALLGASTTPDPEIFHAPDSASYIALARQLADSGRFARAGEPEIVRTPGYPLALLPGVAARAVEPVTVGLQVLIGGLTVYLAHRIALLLFRRPSVATACALLYALEPLSVVYTCKLLSETLFTCLTAAFLYALLRYLKNGRIAALLAAAAALAASAYVRPINYPLPLIVALGLTVRALARRRSLKLAAHAVLFLLVAGTPLALWQARNAAVAGYGGFSAIADETLYFYQAAAVLAAERGAPYYTVQREMGYRDKETYLRNHPEQRPWSRAERARFQRDEGARTLARSPLVYAPIHLKGMARVLFDPAAFDYLKLFRLYPESGGLLGTVVDQGVVRTALRLMRERPLAFWANVMLGAVLLTYLLLAALALCSKHVWRNPGVLVLLAIALYFLVLSGGPQAEARFRHPIMPVVCVLAAVGISKITARLKRSPQTSPADPGST